ncbi:MAG TPA: hypothetical protein VGC16_09645 [Rhizomicrobium sp.]
MNIRVQTLCDTAAAPRKKKFSPRLDILDEVVAGIFWMALDLPDDTSREELEEFAHHLARRIRGGAGESAIAAEIDFLQRRQFCRTADAAVTAALARRTIAIVTGG